MQRLHLAGGLEITDKQARGCNLATKVEPFIGWHKGTKSLNVGSTNRKLSVHVIKDHAQRKYLKTGDLLWVPQVFVVCMKRL
jgi:hypothetical protein